MVDKLNSTNPEKFHRRSVWKNYLQLSETQIFPSRKVRYFGLDYGAL